MKRGIVGMVVLLVMTGMAAAQEPAPLPPPADEGGLLFAQDPGQAPPRQPMQPQAPMQPRAPMPPQPPQPGQPDLGKWWKNSDIVRELQLSDAQISQLEQAFMEHRLKLIDLRATVEREETKLQPLIEADQLDMPKVSAQLDAVLAARAQLEKQNTMMMLSLRKVLTVEQWKKLQAIHEGHQRMRMHEPGPPGHPRKPAPPPEP